MKYFIFLLLLLPSLAFSQKGPITIHLLNGEQITTNYAKLESNNSVFSQAHVRIDDRRGEKIPIGEVSFIEGYDQQGEYKYFKPIRLQGSEIWGERTYTSDRIEIYYTNIISGSWSASYNSKYFQYSKDGAPLKKLTYANLKRDLADNAESMEHLKKANSLRVAQYLFYGLGAGLIVASIASTFNDDELRDPGDTSIQIPPSFIAGAISLYVPWFMNSPKQNHFVDALQAYE